MCPNCRAFITTSDRVCPYCQAVVGPRAVTRRQSIDALGGLIPHARFTTVMILLVNTALFVATYVYTMRQGGSESSALIVFGAKLPLPYMHGQWWRLVTAGFLHGGLLHILMNSWVLFDLGAEVEMLYGTSRLIVFYFISTVCGFLLSALFGPGISVGSSAGIYGLIGAMIAFGIMDKSALGAAVKSLYVRWAMYGLVLSFIPGVDIWAHIGGGVSGLAAGLLAGTPRARAMWKEPLLRGAAGTCLALTALSFLLMFLSFARSTRGM